MKLVPSFLITKCYPVQCTYQRRIKKVCKTADYRLQVPNTRYHSHTDFAQGPCVTDPRETNT